MQLYARSIRHDEAVAMGLRLVDMLLLGKDAACAQKDEVHPRSGYQSSQRT